MTQSAPTELTVYTITIQGELSIDWSEYLGGGDDHTQSTKTAVNNNFVRCFG